MPIDRTFFSRSVLGASLFYGLATKAFSKVKESGDIEKLMAQMFGNAADAWLQAPERAASPLDEQMAKSVVATLAESEAKDTHVRDDEIIQRATFVYAWSILDHLLQSCVGAILQREPQRLLARLEKDDQRGQRAIRYLRSQLTDAKSREDVILTMIREECATFGGKPLSEKHDFFVSCLDLRWEREWFDALHPLETLRTRAAHEPTFPLVPDDKVWTTLAALHKAGWEIADACLARVNAAEAAAPTSSPSAGR